MLSLFHRVITSFGRQLWLVSLSLLLSACSMLPSQVAKAPQVVFEPVHVGAQRRTIPDAIQRVIDRPDDIWGYLAWGFSWQYDGADVDRERARILQQAQFFDVLSERANPGLAWIVREIEQRDLPLELALIPIIESMLDPWAYSSQRAAGLWQVSPATAAHYGLEVNWWYDARLDIPVATEFALDYLQELYNAFDNDWLLALAAYNGGWGRVTRAIQYAERHNKPTDYWSLRLPRETRRYVPRLLALAQILRDPVAYQIDLPELSRDPAVLAVATHGQIELDRAAELAGIKAGELRRLNPAQLRWATDPQGHGLLWLPADRADVFANQLAELTPEQRVEWAHYQIVPGDSLSTIAKRFDTEINLIRAVNQLDSPLIRAGDELIIPRSGQWTEGLAGNTIDWPPAPARKNRATRRYQVRSGDSLWVIARRHGTTVSKLQELNDLRGNSYLQPGQVLQLGE